MRTALRPLLVACFFVCPLLFFTNLTRNPYVTQISLLNMALLWAGAALLWQAADRGPEALARTPLDAPLLAWTGVCALSWAAAYGLHQAFYRPAMAAEGGRAFLFLLANALIPFYLGARLAGDGSAGDADDVPLAAWAAGAAVWGFLWLGFRELRAPSAPPGDVWGQVWDGYGAVLWAAGAGGALWLCRRGRWLDFFHLALATGFLASAYGVLQYFNFEFIWPQALNPYGGRSVSTFGNPNFLSSFNVVLLPAAVTLFSRSRGGRRAAYGVLALTLEAALLCSLTRSSWLGALAGLGALLLSPDFRRSAAAEPKPHGLLAATAAAMALLWPSSSVVSGYTPSVAGRVSEVISAIGAGQKYGSLWQRLLIWTCGWMMGAENPLTGKGYGLFELFYPFYQGHILSHFDFWRPMRTHANNAHNELVEVWSQTGLLGLGVYLWLWAAFAAAAARRFVRQAAGRGVLLASCAAGAAGMLVDNMLNVSLHFAVPAFIFWWTLGSACAPAPLPARPAGKGTPPPAQAPAWRWGLRLGAVLLAALSWVWVRVWFREAHYFAGFKLAKHGMLPAAERALERSRAWGPREVNAIYELGNVFAQSRQYPKAAQAYAHALRANAGYDEIYYNLAAVQSSHLGLIAEAVANFRVSQWINPLSAEVYVGLGNICLTHPQLYYDLGLDLLEEAVRIFPDNAAHWSNLGYLYALRQRWAEAERAYARGLSLDPASPQIQANLEALYRQSGRPRGRLLESARDLRELEQRVARQDYSPATLALARRLDAALPDTPKVRFFLGGLLLAQKKPDEAVGVLSWVVAREPRNLWARLNLGEAYLMLGRREQALEQYRAALAVDGSSALARRRLSEFGGR